MLFDKIKSQLSLQNKEGRKPPLTLRGTLIGNLFLLPNKGLSAEEVPGPMVQVSRDPVEGGELALPPDVVPEPTFYLGEKTIP